MDEWVDGNMELKLKSGYAFSNKDRKSVIVYAVISESLINNFFRV
jgi:hypothetical protein